MRHGTTMTATSTTEPAQPHPDGISSAVAARNDALFAFRATAFVFVFLLVAFGGLMWALRGEAVFTDLVSTVLAWCM
jgi:hypothetical protein